MIKNTCEICTIRKIDRYHETIRDKAGNAKIMSVCKPCFEKHYNLK